MDEIMVFLGCLPEEEIWLHPGSNWNGKPLGPCFLLWPGEISSHASSISFNFQHKKSSEAGFFNAFFPLAEQCLQLVEASRPILCPSIQSVALHSVAFLGSAGVSRIGWSLSFSLHNSFYSHNPSLPHFLIHSLTLPLPMNALQQNSNSPPQPYSCGGW